MQVTHLSVFRYYTGMEGVGNSPDQLDGFGKSLPGLRLQTVLTIPA